MTIAYVLINTDLNSEEYVQKSLKSIQGVEAAYQVYGVYDLVAKVKSGTLEDVKNIITNRIRKVKNVRSTITLVAVE